MRPRTAFWTLGSLFLCLLLTTSACKKGETDSESNEEGEESPAREPAGPVEMVPVTITVEPSGFSPGATAQVPLPEGWHEHDFFSNTWLPGDDPFDVALKAETGCGGVCDAASIPGQIEQTMSDIVGMLNAGMGEHLQPIYEEIERGDLPLGSYIAYRLTYPPAPQGEASGRPGTYLECFLHNPTDDRWFAMRAEAVPEDEAAIWPTLLDSCRGATYQLIPAER